MLSIPRDLFVYVPMWGMSRINRAYGAAETNGYPGGGPALLEQTILYNLGIPIHYFGAINLLGFKQMVDAIGGVNITVTRAINDPTYVDEYGDQVGFYLQPRTYHMNGHPALAFARSRKGVGDSDFTRADRQQQLLTAIQEKLTAGNLLLALPGLLDAVKNTIATDVPSGRLAELARAVQRADVSELQRVVLQPPEYMRADPFSSAGYILIPDLDAIRAIGEALLTGGTIGPTPSPSASP